MGSIKPGKALKWGAAVLWVVTGLARSAALEIEAPGMEAVVFAQAPLMGRPVALAVNSKDKLLVFERLGEPPDAESRVVALSDEDADGKAERREVFLAGLHDARSLAMGGDGWVYVLTRDELLRARDTDGDGRADEEQRRLVVLEQAGNDPERGLSGLVVSSSGHVCFGVSGARSPECRLRFAERTSEACGSDGSIWRMGLEGQLPRRLSIGLARIGGLAVNEAGHLFATDQTAQRRHPARLLQTVPDADHGYRKSWEEVAWHPFFSWRGEKWGTLPPRAEAGDAPGGLTCYAPKAGSGTDFLGLPVEWHGSLLVTSSGDHRLDGFSLKMGEGSGLWTIERRPFIQGDREFRPRDVVARADGALWVADEGAGEGQGKVWLIRRQTPGVWQPAVPAQLPDPIEPLRELIADGPAPLQDQMLEWLGSRDPLVFHLAVQRLSRDGVLARQLAVSNVQFPAQARAGVLLACRLGSEREGVDPSSLALELDGCLKLALLDSDPRVAMLAMEWVAEARISRCQTLLEAVLGDATTPPKVLVAALIAAESLDSAEPVVLDAARFASQLEVRMRDPSLSSGARFHLFQARSLVKPAAVNLDDIRSLLAQVPQTGEHNASQKPMSEHQRVWLTHYLGLLKKADKQDLLRELAFNPDESAPVRAAALSHFEAADVDAGALMELAAASSGALRAAALSALTGLRLSFALQQRLQSMQGEPFGMSAQRVLGRPHFPPGRPQSLDVGVWMRYLRSVPGETDAGHGRDVFFSPRSGDCARCHQVEGLGNRAGPDLNACAGRGAGFLLTSLLRPSATVHPDFKSWKVLTGDGRERLLCLYERGLDSGHYFDSKGNVHLVKDSEVKKRVPAAGSVMPEELPDRLTDEEIRDLLAFLSGLGER